MQCSWLTIQNETEEREVKTGGYRGIDYFIKSKNKPLNKNV